MSVKIEQTVDIADVRGYVAMALAAPGVFETAILPTLADDMRTAVLAAMAEGRRIAAREVSDKFVKANREATIRKFLPWGRVNVGKASTPETFADALDTVCAYIREFGRTDEVNGTHVLKFTHIESGAWAEVPEGQRGAVRVGGMALTVTARDLRGYVDPITAAEVDAAEDAAAE